MFLPITGHDFVPNGKHGHVAAFNKEGKVRKFYYVLLLKESVHIAIHSYLSMT